MDKTLLFNIFGIVGFFLSFISYFMYIPEALVHIPTVIGMVIVTSGYALLFVANTYSIHANSIEEKEKKEKLQMNIKIIATCGYAFLAVFFFAIHIVPQMTFQLRFYDVFAAIGNLVAVFTKFGYIPLWFAFTPLIIYYVLAGSIKVFEKGLIEKVQLVARLTLAAYYILGLQI